MIILSIGAVNAADNATDENVGATDQEIIADSPDPGSFTELNNYITQEINQGHTTISLNKSYEFLAMQMEFPFQPRALLLKVTAKQ